MTGPLLPGGTVLVRVASDGMTAPARVAAGPVRFDVSSERELVAFGVARLAPGATFDDLCAGLTGVTADDPATVRAGARRLQGTDLLGGLLLRGRGSGTLSHQHLEPGRYELFDYADVTTAPRPTRSVLTVDGAGPVPPRDEPTATLTTVADPAPRFILDGDLRSGRPVRLVNELRGQPTEAVFFALADDVPSARVEEWFRRFRDVDPPPDPPIDLAAGIGGMPHSSGHSTTVTLPLPPGRYVVASVLNDFTDGVRMASKGQHKIVRISSE